MPQDFRAILEEGFAAWNRHDAAGLAALVPEDAVLRTVATGEAARGPAKVRALAEARLEAFPDWRLERHSTYDCGEAVCVEWTLTGTHEGEFMGIPATGRRVEMPGCSVFKLTPERLLREETIYFDAATMLRQLGVLPDT